MSTSVGNWRSILVLVFFLVSNAAVVLPVRVPVPNILSRNISFWLNEARVTNSAGTARRVYLHLNFITVPLISVLILLTTGAIDGTVVRDGIVGANGVKPLNIMALFISLAYLSISLDATGLLRFLALWVARKGGSSGRRLFSYLYFFFLLCGIIVGNDPVILSGTAFLAYLTRVSGITDPRAWIFSQFVAANMASVVLVSSNPTNLVLSGAFSLSFTTYTAHCILPFLAAALVMYPIFTFVLFRSSDLIPRSIDSHMATEGEISETLVDRRGAIFGSGLLLVTLGVLVGTSTVGVSVWEVTVPPAAIMLLRDLHHDWSKQRTLQRAGKRLSSGLRDNDGQADGPGAPNDDTELQPLPTPPDSQRARHLPRRSLSSFVQQHLEELSSSFPTVSAIAKRLPYPLLPFAFLMFILVQGLSANGWVEVLARWWAAWTSKTGVLGAIGGMGFLACIFCNICGTNIGATILLARVIQLWISTTEDNDETLDPRSREGAIYALGLGSNYGAFTLTFSASLAGLLWRRILWQKGIHVRAMHFLRLNLPISIVAMTVSSAVLLGQTYVVHGQ